MGIDRVIKPLLSGSVNKRGIYKSTTQEILEQQAAEIRVKLLKEASDRFKRQVAIKERNVALPRPVYEGPRNVKYWITRRRSGMRK